MSCDQALDKLSEKLNSRLLVQEEHGFQKGGTMCPLAAGAQKSLAWIGLNIFLEAFQPILLRKYMGKQIFKGQQQWNNES